MNTKSLTNEQLLDGLADLARKVDMMDCDSFTTERVKRINECMVAHRNEIFSRMSDDVVENQELLDCFVESAMDMNRDNSKGLVKEHLAHRRAILQIMEHQQQLQTSTQ